ncbi:MAG: DUF4129 domain-containing protein [Chloroflexus sp.]
MTQPSLVGPALLITMLITIPLTLISEQVAAYTSWQSLWLSGASVLVSLEAIALRSRMVAGLHETQGGALRYLAAEVFGLAALARIVATCGQGTYGITAMKSWITDPLAAFDPPFLFCLLTLLAVAILSRSGIAAIAALTPNPPLKTPLQSLDLLFYRSDAVARRQAAVKAISRSVVWGGLVTMVVLESDWSTSSSTWPTVGIMALYLCGGLNLILLAQRRALLADWQSEEAEIAPDVYQRWRWLSVALSGLVILLALALPSSSIPLVTDDWREAIIYLVGVTLLVMVILATFFIGLASTIALIPLLLLMLLDRFQESVVSPAQLILLPTVEPPPASEPLIWPGVIFWLCMGLLAGLAFWTILRRQDWINSAKQQVQHWMEQMVITLLTWRTRRQYRRKPSANQRRLWTTRQSSHPAAAIIYYHTALRAAARHGYQRHPSQTPAEFAAALHTQLPAVSPELQALTAAYHCTAYANRSLEAHEQRHLANRLHQFRRKLDRRGNERRP